MGRGPKPAKSKEAKPAAARKSSKNEDSGVRDLKKRLAEALQRETEGLKREAEAQAQRAATAEILRLISSSPADVQPVFDAIVAAGRRLSGGLSCTLRLLDGEVFRLAAFTSTSQIGDEAMRSALLMPVGEPLAQMMRTRAPVFVADTEIDPLADAFRERARARGFRSVINVPLLRKGRVMGVMHVTRQEPGTFAPPEIALLETFADQAVIAIENVRLFNETKEALEQQTATAEILSVISGSPTDIQPVFDAVLDRALSLCEASHGSLYQFEDGALRHVAARGTFVVGFAVGGVLPLESATGRAVLEKRAVHLEDVQQELDWQASEVQVGVRGTGIRTVVAVPLLREQMAIGAITIRRLEVRPFSEKQIALLQTFADQAVIAIENVRLFKALEARNKALTESLDRQTATAEILRVISSSPTDLQPVMDAVAENAARVCGATDATIRLIEGDIMRVASRFGAIAPVAPEVIPVDRDSHTGRAIIERRTIHIEDIRRLPETEFPRIMRENQRTVLATPLMRKGEPIGVILIRRVEVNPFADKQIELLKTFADQAVIAIENVRLFKELEARNRDLTEALEQQTATADILRVISSSPTNV